MAKKMTAVEKAYAMFGTGEWVAESGKVRETRLIKELVEAAEEAEKRAERAEEDALRCNRFEWLYNQKKVENDALKGEIKILQDNIAAFNSRLDEIRDFVNLQRIR